ncbi:MATE family efflux transporter [Ligilactobacillus ceti]|uniref:Na+ driven multidrug efflux pump n=1 Tax=Ligilactobacillus ceti DSM 22408 TaxID=1122146 RepID=A0A0R2KQB2_9LACO|nr:MATE family efflux transporter [Ligilactobacillus ceti]KRN88810.1 hypothetical protein IV53_GL000780 [Ligilactobacillus ceti DSM 22408]
MENIQLGKESLLKLFIKYVLPAIISMVITGIQGMIDGIFLGNYGSINSMAAVNVATPFMQLWIGTGMIICIGTLSYLGITLGQNDNAKAKDIFKSAVVGLSIISMIITVLGVCFSGDFARLLGANQVLMNDTKAYIFTFSFFIFFATFMLLFGFVDRLIGKPRLYLYATIGALITNITGDFIAIKILHLGVVGAAIATGLAYLVGFLITLPPLMKKSSAVNIFDGRFRLDIFIKASVNGSSEGISYLATALALFLFNRAFLQFAGEGGIAAFTVIMYIQNFAVLLMFGVSDGISSIVSYNYGAGNHHRVRKVFYLSAVLNFVFGLLSFLVLFYFGEDLILLFIKDNPAILKFALDGMNLFALNLFFCGFNILQSGFNTAVDNPITSMWIAISRGFLLIPLAVLVLPRVMDVQGLWLALPMAELGTALICLWIMFKKRDLYFK